MISRFGWWNMVLFVKLGALGSRDEIGTAWISWFLRNVVCKVLCLCLPLELPDGPNPRWHQARHVVTTPRRGTRRGAIFVASEASVATNNLVYLEQPSITKNTTIFLGGWAGFALRTILVTQRKTECSELSCVQLSHF